MPPAYVKPYVKRQKNDAADAEAICEAVTRANMRRQTALCSGVLVATNRVIRANLAEFGIVASVGRKGVEELLDVVANSNDERLPEIAH